MTNCHNKGQPLLGAHREPSHAGQVDAPPTLLASLVSHSVFVGLSLGKWTLFYPSSFRKYPGTSISLSALSSTSGSGPALWLWLRQPWDVIHLQSPCRFMAEAGPGLTFFPVHLLPFPPSFPQFPLHSLLAHFHYIRLARESSYQGLLVGNLTSDTSFTLSP